MIVNPFLQCLSATGINTGFAVLGLYAFNSGDSNLVYNQIYPTGYHYISGINSSAIIYGLDGTPLLDTNGNYIYDASFSSTQLFPYNNALPMIYNGFGTQSSGFLTGNSFYQISDSITFDFSTIIYLNYSGCNYNGIKNQILASTSTSSGAILGITPSNRLFVQTPNYSHTISKEIGVGDFAYFSVVGGRFVNFGLFSLADNVFYNKVYDEGSSVINLTDLTFGGALSYPYSFTGYSGKLNEIYLFSGSLTNGYVSGCVNCAFVTGYSGISNPYSYNSTQITGSYWTGITITGLISTSQVITSYPTVNGGTGYVFFDSGTSGLITIGQALVPVTQNVVQTGTTITPSFLFNTVQPMSGYLFDFYFTQGLSSGDIVEIYTYPIFNTNIGFQMNNLIYPNKSGVQLYGNGLAETSGVDYRVAFNSLLVGFDSVDVLQYDLYPSTLTMPYATGYLQTGTTGSNFVNITGISGLNLFSGFNQDIYLNGQKLTSGLNYSFVLGYQYLTVTGGSVASAAFNGPYFVTGTGVGSSLIYAAFNQAGFIYFDGSQWNYTSSLGGGGIVFYTAAGSASAVPASGWSPTIFEASGPIYTVSPTPSVLTVSGNDLQDLNDPSGHVLEIKFIPEYSGFIRNFTQISGNQSYISGVSGFSEQVWVNGARQFTNMDYFKYPRCRFCTGNFINPGFPMVLYNTAVDTIGFFH